MPPLAPAIVAWCAYEGSPADAPASQARGLGPAPGGGGGYVAGIAGIFV